MANVTLAASERAFIKLFEAVRDNFEFAKSDSGTFGPFTASYDLKCHLERGTVDLRGDNTVSIKELDVKWDKLDLTLGIDLPELCIGGFCIIPTPFGCALRAPRWCIFDRNPDISLTLPLGGIVSELSAVAALVVKYFVDPARLPWMDDWDAAEQVPSVANRWQLFIDPQTMDIDPIDVADTVGDLFESVANAAVDAALGWLPGWARSIIKAIIGGVADFIRAILDIPDDIQEWISDLLNVSFGILDFVLTAVADHFAAETPIFELEDPYSMLDAAGNPNTASGFPKLVPVKLPIRDLSVFNDDVEMVVQANLG